MKKTLIAILAIIATIFGVILLTLVIFLLGYAVEQLFPGLKREGFVFLNGVFTFALLLGIILTIMGIIKFGHFIYKFLTHEIH